MGQPRGSGVLYNAPMELRPRAVTFDAGNTLLAADPPPETLYARTLSRHGRPVTAEEVRPVFARVWAHLQRTTPPGRDRYTSVEGGERQWWARFVREVLEELEHDAPWEVVLDELYAAFSDPGVWRVFPDVFPTLERLRAAGLRLGVVSNWDTRLPAILEGVGLTPHFDVITVSALEGVEKPHPEIFARTVERLGVPPDRVVHVGDSPREDYGGAETAGLVPLLVDRPGLFGDDGYRTVGDLESLPGLLGLDGR